MKTSDMIQTVKDNLGNRNSGRIGGRDIDVVVLEAINLAVPHCVLEAQPDYYNRTATINFLSTKYKQPVADPPVISQNAQREYELPTIDSDGEPLTIKNVYGFRCARTDGSFVKMMQLNFKEFVDRTANYDLDFEGTPQYFGFWGKTNTLHLDYIPSEDYTFTMYVEAFPQVILSTQLNTQLPINDQWNIVVESFATKHCFLKLQQTEMFIIWEKLYKDQKKSIGRDESVKQGENIRQGDKRGMSTDPALDPRVSRWN
jgi:hypothetical protein